MGLIMKFGESKMIENKIIVEGRIWPWVNIVEVSPEEFMNRMRYVYEARDPSLVDVTFRTIGDNLK